MNNGVAITHGHKFLGCISRPKIPTTIRVETHAGNRIARTLSPKTVVERRMNNADMGG